MRAFRQRAAAIGLGLVAALGCQHFRSEAPSGEAAAAPAASIDGRTISVDELDAYIQRQLFDEATAERDPAELYQVRSRYLDGMLDEIALEKAASAQNLAPDEYLSQQIEAQGEVPEQEIAAFYEEHKEQMGGGSLDEWRDRISAFLEQQRGGAIVASLREQAHAEILLEPARIDVEAIGPSKGAADAIVTIVEFSDFECPYCQRVVPTIEEVLAKYPEQVRFVYRNLPLNHIHPRAQPAAEAAACANLQGKFWGYHDLIFANTRALADADLERYASQLELDLSAFRKCVKDRETQALVEADLAAAEAHRISGTPSFLVNGIPLHGAQSLEAFSKVIDAEIARLASPADAQR
ncbi:MAG TPA: thioredoxin domain-containing protein [Myxococcota bacterium]|nr:thioredoxin domain-containing protein [Myxococcota bacterium]